MILGGYTVHFRHDRSETLPTVTRCRIHWGECRTEPVDHEKMCCVTPATGIGYAIVGKGDQFCRATGRKIALARAIQYLIRDERRLVWQDYWSRFTP